MNQRKKMSTDLFKNKLPENNVYEYSDNDVKDIQRVWFAGEHTSKDYFGYAHGAWERYDTRSTCYLLIIII